jgi:hypothetical protein
MTLADKPLLPSLDLVRNAVSIELSYTLSRMRVLERLSGNPIGIAYRRLNDTATALMARHLPSPSFNTVTGLSAGDERFVAPTVDWYRDHGVKGRFELVPGLASRDLALELSRHGYFHSGFHVSMIGATAGSEPSAPTGTTVKAVENDVEMEDYLTAYVDGWGIGPEFREQFKANVRPWLDEPGWSLFLGYVGTEAASAATLYVQNGLAYCADATTALRFRGQGLQQALLARRLRMAMKLHAKIAFSGAEFLSTSHRNMARVGMEILFVRALWTAV